MFAQRYPALTQALQFAVGSQINVDTEPAAVRCSCYLFVVISSFRLQKILMKSPQHLHSHPHCLRAYHRSLRRLPLLILQPNLFRQRRHPPQGLDLDLFRNQNMAQVYPINSLRVQNVSELHFPV